MNNRKPSIKERLKGYMEEVSIDLFGIEAKATDNVRRYFTEVSQKTGTAIDELFVIIKKPDQVKAWLIEKRKIHPLPLGELVKFFAGDLYNPELERKVADGVSGYLDHFCEVENLQADLLKIIIVLEGGQPVIHASNTNYPVRKIQIKELIKYFK
ncbi:hypothetical protein GCM10009122_22640 [Fulvivirga kasyanovii]|uniref:Uncharacterized protein n=1 Tax=Fulvivirga kasyanovii TaxID=396812 RepID=A0ABW9RPA7_9BACT|nr:hypothetical protein [Fulvivirga kasyanovii]MTI25750.1 hypothetical protein [Fulvivirga kasyanovii]